MSQFKRLCVYCGSSRGINMEYTEAAHQLALFLSAENIGLVYGGAKVGIMGQLADAMLHYGNEVIGVIPKALVEMEVAHEGITELHVVDSMHERKALMADLADGFILMPGGLGSIEEFFEIVTWTKLGFSKKPCGILNVNNYYDGILKFLDTAVVEHFVRPSDRNIILSESSPQKLLEAFVNYKPPINESSANENIKLIMNKEI